MPSASDIRDAVLRVGTARTHEAIVADLRACIRVLDREVGSWNGPPHGAALTSAETSIEGCRRLAQELRIAIANQRRVLAEAR